MSNPFGYSSNVQLPTKDIVGGYTLPESDIYDATIKQVYIKKTDSGAVGFHINATVKDVERKFVLYPAIAKKDANGVPLRNPDNSIQVTNTRVTREGTEVYLDAFLIADSLARIVFGKPLAHLSTDVMYIEEKDKQTKQPVQVQVAGYKDFAGKEVKLVLQRSVKNKQAKNERTGKWENTNEKTQEIELVKILRKDDMLTINEIDAGATAAAYAEEWLKTWKGKDKNNYKPVAGSAVASGTSSAQVPEADNPFGNV